jgi:hypothetical protein
MIISKERVKIFVVEHCSFKMPKIDHLFQIEFVTQNIAKAICFCVYQNLPTLLFPKTSVSLLYHYSFSRFCKKKVSWEFLITLYKLLPAAVIQPRSTYGPVQTQDVLYLPRRLMAAILRR